MSKTLKVIVAPHTKPFYGTKTRKPGEVINLLPADAEKHSAKEGEPLEDEKGKPLLYKLGKHKGKPILGCGLASWMIPYTKARLKEVLDEIDPPEDLDPVSVPIS